MEVSKYVLYLGPEIPEDAREAALRLAQARSHRDHYKRAITQRQNELDTMIEEYDRLSELERTLLETVRQHDENNTTPILIGDGWKERP